VSAPGAAPDPTLAEGPYRARIRRTTHGVAHITAEDWGSLGYGQGWACGRDYLPVIADQIVKVRGERAAHWGAGREASIVAADLGYRMLDLRGSAEEFRNAQTPPARSLVSGYVAGLNRVIDEAASGDLELPEWARGAEWIATIDELDFYAWLGDVALMGSGRNLVQLIGRAIAPGVDGPAPPAPLEALGAPSIGSNGWAVGGDVTASGHGMVLINPHFPWFAEGRFWECHLQIPDLIDVYGVSLVGTPAVQIGTNRAVAWTHTFSNGHRFTVNRLDLDPADPTRYRYGDDHRQMDPVDLEVEVAGGPPVHRTLWRTHYGPMLNVPMLGWGSGVGFTYRDANADNHVFVEQFLQMDLAESLTEFQSVFHRIGGLPWVNTLAADAQGDIWYTDASATPRLSAPAQERFRSRLETDPVAALMFEFRIAMLDGSDPDDEWQDHPDARAPGLEPPAALPELSRRDVLVNANDSHWLTHPNEPLEGYPVLCGLERTARSLRTRQNLTQALALADRGHVVIDDLIDAVYNGRSRSADLLADSVVERLRSVGPFEVEGHPVDPAAVADVIEAWDRRVTLTSRGVALWREMLSEFAPGDLRSHGALFAEPFDAADGLDTPRGLSTMTAADPSADPVLRAIGHAVRVLASAGVALDATLAETQWAVRGSLRVPVPGGTEVEGVINVLGAIGTLPSASLEPLPPAPPSVDGRDRTGLAHGGYQVTYGASFLAAIEVTADGPVGFGVLAYGQSGDPESIHHADGTMAYSAAELRPLLFDDAAINADPFLEEFDLHSDPVTPDR
jgi:acyl-homoserine-lactone acylase